MQRRFGGDKEANAEYGSAELSLDAVEIKGWPVEHGNRVRYESIRGVQDGADILDGEMVI